VWRGIPKNSTMLNRQKAILALLEAAREPLSPTRFVKLLFLARHETGLRSEGAFYDQRRHLPQRVAELPHPEETRTGLDARLAAVRQSREVPDPGKGDGPLRKRPDATVGGDGTGETSTRKPVMKRFPAGKQERMDLLLDRNSNGRVSREERTELEALVAEAERLMMENTKRLATFARHHGGQQASRATPVTVWVKEASVAP